MGIDGYVHHCTVNVLSIDFVLIIFGLPFPFRFVGKITALLPTCIVFRVAVDRNVASVLISDNAVRDDSSHEVSQTALEHIKTLHQLPLFMGADAGIMFYHVMSALVRYYSLIIILLVLMQR